MKILPCGHPDVPGNVPCRVCATLERMKARRAAAPAAAPPSARKPAGKASRPVPAAVPECVHRGGKIGTDECKACGQQARRIDVLACAVKGSCTADPQGGVVNSVQRCQTCAFEPKAPPTA